MPERNMRLMRTVDVSTVAVIFYRRSGSQQRDERQSQMGKAGILGSQL